MKIIRPDLTYKQNLNILNFQLAYYEGVGQWDIPPIPPFCEQYTECDWLEFGKKIPDDDKHWGCHFFLDDYYFQRVWNKPWMYLNTLRRFDYVLSPDFSLFIDYPQALCLYNHFRKHWCARYWMDNGITVIPTIRWGLKDSYDWCFDGEPENSVVAVSSKGLNNDQEMIRLFCDGYDEMERRLSPRQVLWFGKYCLNEMRDNVTLCKTNYEERIEYLREYHNRKPTGAPRGRPKKTKG